MSKNAFINKYITEANKIIEVKDKMQAKEFVRECIAIFKTEIDNIDMNLEYTGFYKNDSNSDYINDTKIVKAHLENYRVNLKSGLVKDNEKGQIINVNASSNNTNNNSNVMTINMSIDEVRKNISDNTYLGDTEKDELLQKLKEIEDLQKSKESKSKKWGIAKGILSFILDKGADIAIMYIPQILKAIQ